MVYSDGMSVTSSSPTRLCRLASKWRCDKSPLVFHNYTPFYSSILRKIDVKRVFEIGVGYPGTMDHVKRYKAGASLFMWAEYFPQAEIFGADINRDVLFNEGRIKTFYLDQGNVKSLINDTKVIKGYCDLIIDDGSHKSDHQVLTANTLIPLLLSRNGVYIIEDVLYPNEVTPNLHYRFEVEEFSIKTIPDDRLIVIYGKDI